MLWSLLLRSSDCRSSEMGGICVIFTLCILFYVRRKSRSPSRSSSRSRSRSPRFRLVDYWALFFHGGWNSDSHVARMRARACECMYDYDNLLSDRHMSNFFTLYGKYGSLIFFFSIPCDLSFSHCNFFWIVIWVGVCLRSALPNQPVVFCIHYVHFCLLQFPCE